MIHSEMIKSIWDFRGFILSSVKREYQSRYTNSLLGFTWTIIEPLALIFIYTVIFSRIMHSKLPGIESTFSYSIYLCSGIITWRFFAEIISRSQMVFIENANTIKKLKFPRICLPIIVIANASINFGIIFLLFLIFLIISGNFPGWVIISLIPVVMIQMIFAIGLGMILGVLNVFFRDVGQIVGVVLLFWLWFTPIIYPITILPDKLRALLIFNPIASLMSSYQGIFVLKEWPSITKLSPVIFLGIFFCFLGLRLFRKHVGEMVDEL